MKSYKVFLVSLASLACTAQIVDIYPEEFISFASNIQIPALQKKLFLSEVQETAP